MYGSALEPPGSVVHTGEVRDTDMAYDDRRACMQMLARGGRYLEYLFSKDIRSQCEAEQQGAVSWDKYRLDTARGS